MRVVRAAHPDIPFLFCVKQLMRTLSLILLFSLFALHPLFAQQPFDCVDALEICNEDTVMVQYDQVVAGSVPEDVLYWCDADFTSPVGLEFSTIWLRYTITSAGAFAFTVLPPDPLADLDFVVFRSGSNSCEGLYPVRCMFSGEYVGGELDSICLGATGLSLTATDTLEGPGCTGGSDNFLAALPVEAGEQILLAVSVFNGDVDFEVAYTGTATIGCQPVAVSEAAGAAVRVFPNPFHSQLTIQPGELTGPGVWAEIWGYSGQLLQRHSIQGDGTLSTAELPAGLYLVRLTRAGQLLYQQRVVKVKK